MGFRPNGIVTFTTDFGLADGYSGAMKGAALTIWRDLTLVDISHEVPPQDVIRGAIILRNVANRFPAGTVHLAVVDPGVGTARAAVVVQAGGHVLVGPDNGLLKLAVNRLGPSLAWRIERHHFLPAHISSTFHGRDVFAPTAAALAAGLLLPREVGSPLQDFAPLDLPVAVRDHDVIAAQVLYADRFGNAITNATAAQVAALSSQGQLRVRMPDGTALPLRATYAEVANGEPLALIGSDGLLEVAVRDGSAQERFALCAGAAVLVGLAPRQVDG